jgi:hypothetical protein
MTLCQTTLKYLNEQASDGMAEVRRACILFLKQKTIPGVLPEKRKPVPKDWTMEKFINQEGICPLCDLEMNLRDRQNPIVPDHIVPIIKGGKTERKNIQAAHDLCNKAKGSMDMQEWSKYRQTHKIGV